LDEQLKKIMKNKTIKLLIIVTIFCAIAGHEVSAVKKAVFPDEKLLQPMPNAYFVHPNISGSINSTTNVLPTVSNTPTSMQNNSPAVQNTSTKNENSFSFFVLSFVIFILIIFAIIFVYRKFKKNKYNPS